MTVAATTSGINATLALAGHVTGTVTNASGTGVGGIDVHAYLADGSGGWIQTRLTLTAADGSYDLDYLRAGSYRIEFTDNHLGDYLTQYYNNKPTLALADNVAVTGGETTSGINAVLVAAGHITGTVNERQRRRPRGHRGGRPTAPMAPAAGMASTSPRPPPTAATTSATCPQAPTASSSATTPRPTLMQFYDGHATIGFGRPTSP